MFKAHGTLGDHFSFKDGAGKEIRPGIVYKRSQGPHVELKAAYDIKNVKLIDPWMAYYP